MCNRPPSDDTFRSCFTSRSQRLTGLHTCCIVFSTRSTAEGALVQQFKFTDRAGTTHTFDDQRDTEGTFLYTIKTAAGQEQSYVKSRAAARQLINDFVWKAF